MFKRINWVIRDKLFDISEILFTLFICAIIISSGINSCLWSFLRRQHHSYNSHLLSAAVKWQIGRRALMLRLRVHSNEHIFCVKTCIDLVVFLIAESWWYNNRWCCYREKCVSVCATVCLYVCVCVCVLKCKLFQECLGGNILIRTLRCDKDVRFKRSKAIITNSTGHCCSKIYFLLACSLTHTHKHTRTLYLSFSCQRWKENLISIRLNCGGQHYQFKRPGDLTAPTPWWLITSRLWWALHSPLSPSLSLLPAPAAAVVMWCWWLQATHDKCCPYYRSQWEKAQAVQG